MEVQRRRRRLAVAVGLGLAAPLGLSACSLLTDLEGLSDPASVPAEASGPDAPTPDAPALPIDAAVDARVAGDAGADADADAQPVPLVSFSDDFERVDPLGPWAQVVTAGGGTARVETLAGSRRLRSAIGAATAGDQPGASVEKAFDVEVRRVVFSVALQYQSLPQNADEYQILTQVALKTASAFELIYVVLNGGGAGFALQDFSVSPAILSFKQFTMSAGAVHTLEADVTLDGTTSLIVDGVKVVDYPTPSFWKPGKPSVEVGISGTILPTSPNVVFSDDLRFAAY